MVKTTTDLSDFGYREIKEAKKLLTAWVDDGLPVDFASEDVELMFNTSSGYVFLTNRDFQVAMLNGEELELFYTCPECGQEGFADELREYGDECCIKYLEEVGA